MPTLQGCEIPIKFPAGCYISQPLAVGWIAKKHAGNIGFQMKLLQRAYSEGNSAGKTSLTKMPLGQVNGVRIYIGTGNACDPFRLAFLQHFRFYNLCFLPRKEEKGFHGKGSVKTGSYMPLPQGGFDYQSPRAAARIIKGHAGMPRAEFYQRGSNRFPEGGFSIPGTVPSP